MIYQPKIVCYTCITGNYDSLKQPLVISKNIDFICFVDKPELYKNSTIWKIKPIPKELDKLSNVKKQRAIKICPHKYLKEYDISIWVDGSIQIKSDLNDFIKLYDLAKNPLYVRKHLERECIYDEAIICIQMKKDSADTINKQVKKLLNDKYPKKNGLAETNIILRKHNEDLCKKICNEWINMILNGSCRDQLSFDYICWKNNFKYGILDKNKSILNDNDIFFSWLSNHAQKQYLNSTFVTIAICNFNTTKLTNDCIISIIKNIKSFKYKIIIFDNSDKNPFKLDPSINANDIIIIDNTTNKYLNFNKMIVSCFNRQSHNNHASAKHCYSIQYLLNICTSKYMILLDSDIIVKQDFDFIDDNILTSADIQNRPIDFRNKKYISRFVPFVQFFNVNLIKQNNIKYFDAKRIGENYYNNCIYDTGSSFYEDITKKRLPYKKIDFKKYVNHLNAGSWATYKPYQCIVSFTTFGSRLSTIERTCQQLFHQKTSIDFKICITLDALDIARLTDQQKQFIKKHNIEILTGDNKIRPHNKYFFVMQKYRNIPIITIDDDIKYDDCLIQKLYASYLNFPNCISAFRTHFMTYDKNHINNYRKWIFDYRKELKPSKLLFATGVGGVIYPPNILKISNDDMNMINKSILSDDIFLKKKELILGVDVVYVQHLTKLYAYHESFDKNALSNGGKHLYTNDDIIKALNFDNI